MTRKHIFILLISLAAFSVVLIAIIVASTPTSRAAFQGNALPNLVPQTPTGWSGPVVPTFITGTNATGSLYAGMGAVTYFDWAIRNDSDTPVTVPTTTCLSIDGNPVNSWNVPTYTPNSFQTIEDFAYTLPEPGTHTVTLEADCTQLVAESDETDNTWTGEFTWNPYISVIIADEHGFDKCNIATTSQMDVWRLQSPYFYTNIYIGGISRACSNSGLTSDWVRHVVEDGWNLIPTWVGPQAPCSSYTNRFSWNPGTARDQGRREADAAYQAAQSLGLTPPGSPTIIYYDLEAYPNHTFCREASGEFLAGWTARLHELGQLSGVYGAGCGSYPIDWPATPAPPDAVWLAHWIIVPPYYDSSATVWNVACVPNTLWDNFERIRQYAGDHNETRGGVTLNIDSNVARGPVVGINPSLQAGELETSALIRDFQLLASDQGWLIQDGKLLWKNPGGSPWTDLTPPDQTILAAFFLDSDAGWVASPAQAEDGALALDIFSTPDQGKTWQPAGTLPAAFLDGTGGIWLHFVDEQTGWAAVQLPSSSNFSLGQLFRTADGGRTWEQLSLPIGAPVYFVDAQTGWTAGGPAGNELYVTHDGGATWSGLELPAETRFRPGAALYALPTFVDGTGIMPVTPSGESSRVTFFKSEDNGQTWQSAGEIPIPVTHSLDTPLPVSIVDAANWLIANPETGALITTRDATRTTTPLDAAPLQIQFTTPDAGWALTFSAACTGEKGMADFQCTVQYGLWETEDGGETWINITP